jgi:hypothetical protein
MRRHFNKRATPENPNIRSYRLDFADFSPLADRSVSRRKSPNSESSAEPLDCLDRFGCEEGLIPHFRDYHLLLDDQGTQIFAMTDDIAERARKLGGTTISADSQRPVSESTPPECA